MDFIFRCPHFKSNTEAAVFIFNIYSAFAVECKLDECLSCYSVHYNCLDVISPAPSSSYDYSDFYRFESKWLQTDTLVYLFGFIWINLDESRYILTNLSA